MLTTRDLLPIADDDDGSDESPSQLRHARPCVICGHTTAYTVLNYDGPRTGYAPMCWPAHP